MTDLNELAARVSHTPGPWRYDGDHGYGDLTGHRVTQNGELGFVLAVTLADVDPLAAESEANARLIAAAPDLLHAAQMALDFILYRQGNDAGETVTCADLRAAIARATGGTNDTE